GHPERAGGGAGRRRQHAGGEMSSTTLRELVHRVADARRRKAQYDEFVRSVRAEFDEANADLFAQHREAVEALAVAEREARTMAEAAYRETGETKPAPGVAIRVSERPEYDEAKAVEWAKSTGRALIPEELDAKAFAKNDEH